MPKYGSPFAVLDTWNGSRETPSPPDSPDQTRRFEAQVKKLQTRAEILRLASGASGVRAGRSHSAACGLAVRHYWPLALIFDDLGRFRTTVSWPRAK